MPNVIPFRPAQDYRDKNRATWHQKETILAEIREIENQHPPEKGGGQNWGIPRAEMELWGRGGRNTHTPRPNRTEKRQGTETNWHKPGHSKQRPPRNKTKSCVMYVSKYGRKSPKRCGFAFAVPSPPRKRMPNKDTTQMERPLGMRRNWGMLKAQNGGFSLISHAASASLETNPSTAGLCWWGCFHDPHPNQR